MDKQKLTPNHQKAAENLRRLWDEFQAKHKISQEQAAGIIGMTQGAFGHYLNGRNPINAEAAMKFARFFAVHPSKIRPDLNLDFKSDTNNAIVINSPEEVELINAYRATPESGKIVFTMAIKAVQVYITGKDKRRKNSA